MNKNLLNYYVLEGFKHFDALDLFNLEDSPEPLRTAGLLQFELTIPLSKLRPIMKRERLDAVKVEHLDRAAAEILGFVTRYNNRVETRLGTIGMTAPVFAGRPVQVDLVVPSEDSSLFMARVDDKWKDDLREDEIWEKQIVDLQRGRVLIRFWSNDRDVTREEAEEARALCTGLAEQILSCSRGGTEKVLTSLKFLPKLKGDTRLQPKPTLGEMDTLLALRGVLKDVPLSRRPIVVEKHGDYDYWARIPLIGEEPEPDVVALLLDRLNVRATSAPPKPNSLSANGERILWVQLDYATAEDFSGADSPWWKVVPIEKDVSKTGRQSKAKKTQ